MVDRYNMGAIQQTTSFCRPPPPLLAMYRIYESVMLFGYYYL